jgi:hypothetical protein
MSKRLTLYCKELDKYVRVKLIREDEYSYLVEGNPKARPVEYGTFYPKSLWKIVEGKRWE